MSLPTEADFSKETWNRPLVGGTMKTGFSFGLPPIVTCPVVSSLCSKCYANDRGSYRFPDVKRGQLRRFAVAMSQGFTARMVAELTAAAIIAEDEGKHVLRFRLHDAGDFFDIQYIEAWLRIVERLAKVAPLAVAVWAPTRIWAAKAIPVRIGESKKSNPLPLLRELNALPHVAVRPSALEVGTPAPKVIGLAAGHAVVTDAAMAAGAHLCPVAARTHHNRRRRWDPTVETQEASCAACNCRTCWGRKTETVFLKH